MLRKTRNYGIFIYTNFYHKLKVAIKPFFIRPITCTNVEITICAYKKVFFQLCPNLEIVIDALFSSEEAFLELYHNLKEVIDVYFIASTHNLYKFKDFIIFIYKMFFFSCIIN